MASYVDLYQIALEDSGLKSRVTTACIVAAEAIRNELDTTANHANRLLWARRIFVSPQAESERMLWALLAANKDATVAQIQNATDATLQTLVDDAVNLFADGT